MPLTPEQFHDALAKGLGRTMLALREPDAPSYYAELILEACLTNLQFDRQCEANRRPYLWALVEEVHLEEKLLAALLEAFPVAENGWDRDQMIGFLGGFTARGEEQAWDALLPVAESGDEDVQDTLATASDRGLQWAVDHVLPTLAPDARWRIFMWLPDEPEDDITPTQKSLRKLRDEEVKNERSAGPKRTVTPREFLDQIEDPKISTTHAIDFAKAANAAELTEAANLLPVLTNSRALNKLAQVFKTRDFPLPLETLLQRVDDEDRGPTVCRILGRINNPEVRQFGLSLLRKRPLATFGLEILRSSLLPGDEALIAEIFPELETLDSVDRHSNILDLVAFFSQHPNFPWQPHAEWLYEQSPCSMCRDSAVTWMAKHGHLPPSILKEAPYDAEPDIREIT